MRIFQKQSALRIRVLTFCNLEDASKAYIRYQKPNGTRGEFNAGISDAENGVIIYECLENDIDVSGWWTFWAYVIFNDERTAPGMADKAYVWLEGKG